MKNLGKLLQESWNLFRRNFISICSIILPFVIPIQLVYLVAESMDNNVFRGLISPVFLVDMALYPIYQGALILYLGSVVSGKFLNRKKYYFQAIKFWIPLAILYIYSGVTIFVGLLLFLVPGFIAMARLAFSEFYCVFENRSGLDSLSKSWTSTKDYQWLLVFGSILLYISIFFPLYGIEYLLEKFDLGNPVVSFTSSVLSVILLSLVTIFYFRVYTLAAEKEKNMPE